MHSTIFGNSPESLLELDKKMVIFLSTFKDSLYVFFLRLKDNFEHD